MNDLLYEKKVECPVCDVIFPVLAVKKKAYKVERRDTDLRAHYKEIDPLYYDVWICANCGYAALQSHFSSITPKRAALIKQMITSKWVQRDFSQELDVNSAIERYKLALISGQISRAKNSELAILCLKIAWLYRDKENEEKEEEFLNHALQMLIEAFNNERPPIEGMDEGTIMYLIGELYRKTGNNEEAGMWFSKIISGRNANTLIMEMSRDQWQLIKDEMKKE